MKTYIGSKMIMAKPMTRAEYNNYRGWGLPADENGSDEGYLVEYINGGASNHENHDGYVSWSPKDVFDMAYNRIDSMSFSNALLMIKNGKKVARKEWSGHFIYLSPNDSRINMRFVDGAISYKVFDQGDILANDWMLVD